MPPDFHVTSVFATNAKNQPEVQHVFKVWEEIEYRMYLFSLAHGACIECL
jgi:hypothetical protein